VANVCITGTPRGASVAVVKSRKHNSSSSMFEDNKPWLDPERESDVLIGIEKQWWCGRGKYGELVAVTGKMNIYGICI